MSARLVILKAVGVLARYRRSKNKKRWGARKTKANLRT